MSSEPIETGFRFRPGHRILIGLACAALALLLAGRLRLDPLALVMLLWDVFAAAFVATSWLVFFSRSTRQIRQYARKEDGSRVFVFVIILLSAFASMFTVLLLMLSQAPDSMPRAAYLTLAIAGMLLSWVMVHTTFGFHYAHMYYDDDENDREKHAAGLEFPGEKYPDYLDFAYFSFVIGMTFQVSDVEISSRRIRRQALVHGLLSFVLNTFVVALSVNLIAGLRG